MLKNIKATAVLNETVAEGIFRLVLHCPQADLWHFVPGQFAHVRIPEHEELLLGRPLSINAVNIKEKTVTLICRVSGKGTLALSKTQKGTEFSAILPAGRGFNMQGKYKKIFLVGGGVGIAPLPPVVQKWPEKQYEAFLGYRGRNVSYAVDEFSGCEAVHIASDDGTIGERGTVTKLLEKRLSQVLPDVVLACGPAPMLRELKRIVEAAGLSCQVSVEQRMCCGFGACAACVCGVNTPDGRDYKKVCVEGPVFDIREVIL
ncbi:MAG: dihydroorotate dehydrogenase electron transfer subunit [Christensenellales bacterium]